MVFSGDAGNGPILKAAKIALETGNPNYILIWIPEESENTYKNLLEKTCCERSVRKNTGDCAIGWYFETVNRFHYAGRCPHYVNMKSDGLYGSQIIPDVEGAIESGNFEKIIARIPDSHVADARERFHRVRNKRNYDINNIAAGRAYVSAFITFIEYVQNLSSGIIRDEGRVHKFKNV